MVSTPSSISSPEDRAQLLELLRTKSYREGEVVLSSGKVSDFYVDCRQTSLNALGQVLIGRLIYQLIKQEYPQAIAVGGPTLGADPMVCAVSLTSALHENPLHAFIVRKEAKGHGTGAWVEGMGNIEKGAEVIMVEDVVTSGGSLLRAISRVEEAGLNVLASIILVDRMEGGRETVEKAGHKLISLFSRHDFLPNKP